MNITITESWLSYLTDPTHPELRNECIDAIISLLKNEDPKQTSDPLLNEVIRSLVQGHRPIVTINNVPPFDPTDMTDADKKRYTEIYNCRFPVNIDVGYRDYHWKHVSLFTKDELNSIASNISTSISNSRGPHKLFLEYMVKVLQHIADSKALDFMTQKK